MLMSIMNARLACIMIVNTVSLMVRVFLAVVQFILDK
jgi:hypothetical protein